MRDVELTWGAATDTGQRAENQDSNLASPPVFLVADGMGGHAAGRQASAVVVDRLARTATEGGEPMAGVEELLAAVQEADDEIRRVAGSIADARGMGTTVAGIALVRAEGRARWAVFHVGDSRVYLLAGGQLSRVSIDHSVVQELLDMGLIQERDVAAHPQRHLVTRALGVGPVADAEVRLLPVEAGQRFLICSDGLTGELTDAEIAELLEAAPTADAAAGELVRTAAERGASDNVTAVVVEVRAADD